MLNVWGPCFCPPVDLTVHSSIEIGAPYERVETNAATLMLFSSRNQESNESP